MMDGPGGLALTQDASTKRWHAASAVARVRQELTGKEGLVLRALERRRGQGPEDREARSRSTRRRPSCWPRTPPAGCCTRERAGTGSSNIPDDWCMLDPIKFGIVCPGMKADGQLDDQGHPGRYRHRLSRPARHRAVAHHRPHGAVPLLHGHHKGEVGHAAQHAARLQDGLRSQRAAHRGPARRRAAGPERYAGMGLRDLGDRCGST